MGSAWANAGNCAVSDGEVISADVNALKCWPIDSHSDDLDVTGCVISGAHRCPGYLHTGITDQNSGIESYNSNVLDGNAATINGKNPARRCCRVGAALNSEPLAINRYIIGPDVDRVALDSGAGNGSSKAVAARLDDDDREIINGSGACAVGK